MDKFLKITEEAIVSAYTKSFESDEYKDAIKAIGEDTGTFEVIVSSEHKDRMHDIIKQDGWELERYKKNPVVLWGHDHKQLPVGVCDKLEVTTFEGEKALKAHGRFASHEFAQECRRLYDAGMLVATSVGFIPKKYNEEDYNVIEIAELLEFSFVSVPANPFALSTLSKMYKPEEIGSMFAKGIISIEKEETEEEKTEESPSEAVEEPESDEKDVEVQDDETENNDPEEVNSEEDSETEKTIQFDLNIKEHIQTLDEGTLKAVILALEALMPSQKDIEEPEGEGEQPQGDEQEPAKAFLKLRKDVQEIAASASEALYNARTEAKKLY